MLSDGIISSFSRKSNFIENSNFHSNRLFTKLNFFSWEKKVRYFLRLLKRVLFLLQKFEIAEKRTFLVLYKDATIIDLVDEIFQILSLN